MLYAIADLHLSIGLEKGKPMDIFGDNWTGHHMRIKENWSKLIKEEDTVLIPGDLSWAMDMEDFLPDLAYVHDLPGKKIIISGNHDYWWNSTSKLNNLYDEIFFLKNSFAVYKDFHICGTRGWVSPGDAYFTLQDMKIYKRELNRLKLSLDSAMCDGAKRIVVMFHYPPFSDKKEPSGFVDIIREYPVEKAIYGHLHGSSFRYAVCGEIDGVDYRLVSSDYMDFVPYKVLD